MRTHNCLVFTFATDAYPFFAKASVARREAVARLDEFVGPKS
jgi:hypothetical protein